MEQHDGLVHAFIRRQGGGDIPYEEALQAGRGGLWRAIQGYDPARGTAFSTYAWVAICRHIHSRAKWRCAKRCRHNGKKPVPKCPYLKGEYKHGYTVAVGRTHPDGSVRLAREIPFGSSAWKERYRRRNSAESRNSLLERLGLDRMPVHGQNACHVTILQSDFVANQRTLLRLIREATVS